MYHIFQFSFRKLIECMFIHSAKMIPYKMLFIIDVFMIINHYVTYNHLNNLTIYNKRKTCTDIITCLFKQKNFPFIHFQSPFSLIRSSTSLLASSISSKEGMGIQWVMPNLSLLTFAPVSHSPKDESRQIRKP